MPVFCQKTFFGNCRKKSILLAVSCYNSNVITIQVTPEQIVAFGVVAAVVITLTCIVTIVLINKTSKKESKKEKVEVKTENKE